MPKGRRKKKGDTEPPPKPIVCSLDAGDAAQNFHDRKITFNHREGMSSIDYKPPPKPIVGSLDDGDATQNFHDRQIAFNHREGMPAMVLPITVTRLQSFRPLSSDNYGPSNHRHLTTIFLTSVSRQLQPFRPPLLDYSLFDLRRLITIHPTIIALLLSFRPTSDVDLSYRPNKYVNTDSSNSHLVYNKVKYVNYQMYCIMTTAHITYEEDF
ncbi:hypothetical protein IEQ34_021804 [Dendrobium chrysotoxum]|uniref:Uncharacterized protein n=1 Tax=Dendrobium chrysotoxum TaxID=161865 RepID=A0AAV7G6K4_DENCH|nr:hypothetical protein IEQ34_021804 [Dendrobium chrysotoxum]